MGGSVLVATPDLGIGSDLILGLGIGLGRAYGMGEGIGLALGQTVNPSPDPHSPKPIMSQGTRCEAGRDATSSNHRHPRRTGSYPNSNPRQSRCTGL